MKKSSYLCTIKLKIMETFRLLNGVEMPLLGYGVFQVSPEECERCVSDALSVGYRLIDTAQAYQNEEGVGNAWRKSGIRREDLFLATKVWISNAGEEKAAKSIDESLRKLQTEYIDLLLIHQAYGDVFGTWRAMEKAYRAGKVRAIGVSNFQAGRFFDFAHYVEVKPMVNQLQCNVMIQQTGIEPIHAEFGTKMMAWGPLGGQGVDGIVKSEVLTAIGAKYGKSAAQVALRWLTQRGIVAIPKSSHKERMAQNFDIFDFSLTADEMAQIGTMNQYDTGNINFSDPQFVKYLIETYG
jgi:diketogulonate reductase-like aldo/keto reductase